MTKQVTFTKTDQLNGDGVVVDQLYKITETENIERVTIKELSGNEIKYKITYLEGLRAEHYEKIADLDIEINELKEIIK